MLSCAFVHWAHRWELLKDMSMPNSAQDGEVLYVAIIDQVAYVKVIERGSFKVSGGLKHFGAALGEEIKAVAFDLRSCVGMDSTFMGVVAGLASRLKRKQQAEVHMIGLSPRTRSLLSTLGLDQLVTPHEGSDIPEPFAKVLNKDGQNLEIVEEPNVTRKETAELMHEAHSTLVDLHEENAPRFKDVLTFLQEDIQREEESQI